MKKCLLVSAMLIGSMCSYAQLTFGPKVGVNASTTRFKDETALGAYRDYNPGYKAGLQLGVEADYEITYNFSLRADLLYNQTNYKMQVDNGFATATQKSFYNYLTIPVSAVGKFTVGPGRLHTFAGLYASVSVIAKYKVEDESGNVVADGKYGTTPVSADSTMGSINFAMVQGAKNTKPLDAGLHFGVGYQYQRVLFTTQVWVGMTNKWPKYEDVAVQSVSKDVVSQNRMISFSLTYFFGKIE